MNPSRGKLAQRIKDVINTKGILKVSKDIIYEALTGSEKRYPFRDKVELAKAFCLKEMPQKLENGSDGMQILIVYGANGTRKENNPIEVLPPRIAAENSPQLG